MSDKYIYLFPYEKVPKDSRIIIYGAGDVGQAYLEQLLITRYCDLLFFVDRYFKNYPPMVVPVYSPEKVKEYDFDYILIAMKTGVYVEDIKNTLKSFGIPTQKIIYQGIRNNLESLVINDYKNIEINKGAAYALSPLSIAIKMGPNLGDAIVRKKLFCEIVGMAPESIVDIYTPGGAKFIKSCYGDEPNLGLVIDDGGAMYAANQKKYGVAISISFMIRIDYVNYDKLYGINPLFAEAMIKHMERHEEYGLSLFPSTQNRIHIERAIKLGRNYYTAYNYTGIFKINDNIVKIPMCDNYKSEYYNLRLGKYITFNYGNGSSKKGNKEIINKQWPKEYFESFIEKFKNKYPFISVVQVGDSNTDKIINADRYVLGQDLELVKYVLKGTIFHLDTEGGLVHLASQLGSKCVVIFGPTQCEFFGYPQNINIISKKCSGCNALYTDFRCAKGMERPECMWGLTPEVVMDQVEDVLENV